MAVKGKNKKLLPHHMVIMRLLLQGKTKADIARVMDMTEAGVALIVSSDIFQAEFQKLSEKANERAIDNALDTRQELEELEQLSIRELRRMLQDPLTADRVKVDIIFDVLDRRGVREPEAPAEASPAETYSETAKAAFKRRKEIAARRALEASSIDRPALPAQPIEFGVFDTDASEPEIQVTADADATATSN